MDEIILSYLGPYSGWILALSFGLVVFKRNAIRKRHLAILVGITVAAFVAFFAVLLVAFVLWNRSSVNLDPLLFTFAALTIGCGSAVGFSLVLVTLGLADPEGDDEAPRPRRIPRSRR